LPEDQASTDEPDPGDGPGERVRGHCPGKQSDDRRTQTNQGERPVSRPESPATAVEAQNKREPKGDEQPQNTLGLADHNTTSSFHCFRLTGPCSSCVTPTSGDRQVGATTDQRGACRGVMPRGRFSS